MDKSWLIDPKIVSLIRSMRRYINMEFGVSLSLTDDSLYEQLCAYTEKTRNERLQTLRAQLDQAVKPPEPEPAPEKPARVYRGQVMAQPEPSESAEHDAQLTSKRPKKERMYRGQRVTD